jgi:AhpD family alkylhydroperoxidase
MNPDIRQIEWEACLLEPRPDREMEAFARREMGLVPEALAYFTPCPWVARAEVLFTQRLAVRLDPQLADAVGLVVSHENSCRFCYAMVRTLLRIQGMSEERVQELEARLGGSEGEPRLAAATAFARRMARSAPPVDAEARRRLEKAGFGEAEYLEIAFVVAFMVFANRLTTIPAIPPYGAERAPRGWRFRLLRPFWARALAPFTQMAARTSAPAGPVHFARLVAVYDGSAIGAALARLMREAWTSSILPQRAKALMFAVIAKGLGCPAARGEADAMLRAVGLDAETSGRALDHLNAPGLTETENLLLGFARDTLWYQPAVIQRRARVVRDRLGAAGFVEAVGVCALGNAMGRLCAAVLHPIGDGILAYFGAFEPNPWQSDDAVRAALAMRRALADYNRELQKDGLPPLAIGIGLHRGTVLAGLVGTRERMEYACIGRTVNVASRVQALTRTHDADILLTGTVRERLDPSFTLVPRPATPIKGIAEPIVTFAVV